MSFDHLQDLIKAKKNPTVAGLDPKPEYVPPHIRKASYDKYGETLEGAADAILQFNKGLMDALCDVVPAVKPQAAYYENLGWRGMEMLERTIQYAKSKGLYVIADIKRGDIGSTAAAYAEGWLTGPRSRTRCLKPSTPTASLSADIWAPTPSSPSWTPPCQRTSASLCWSKPPIPAPGSCRTWWPETGWSIRWWAT